ncbi:hypothetical protein WIS52_12330 [Pseudonocardia nematodicida]|uniref:DNA-binding transcriptional regulator of glucitol operon n=1 Tax=Pseudonocardia nematodicida TaxID=1206997 RepID=A0ABV1K9W4_9PSEU
MLRLLVSPRWIAWHVLTLGAMVTCGFLAAWQWGRAGSAMGSAVNIGYGLQWPAFAVFFGYMWWRFLRMEVADLEAAAAAGEPSDAGQSSVAPSAGVTPGSGEPGPAGAVTATAGPSRNGSAPAAVTPGAAEPTGAEPTGATSPDGTVPPPRRSPFTPRPAGVTMARHTDPQLRAYNAELARLADRHREETTT